MHVGDSNVKGMMGPGEWLFSEFSFLLAIPPFPFCYLPCFYSLSPKPGMKEPKRGKALWLLRFQDVCWTRLVTQ